MTATGLLAGPDPLLGMESLADHVARLGPVPAVGSRLIDILDRSDLRGRGGAAFPVGPKWRSIAKRTRGSAVVLANGSESEPLSGKDRVLMENRPHLVIDGAFLAATALRADDVVFYVGEGHRAAGAAMRRALAERPDAAAGVRIIDSPARYVAGEESAAVHYVNDMIALPQSTPPRPYERGVGGRPTLVQNVETLAHVALIARHGDRWFRDCGRGSASGTTIVTVTSGSSRATVVEVPQGTTIVEAVTAAGLSTDGVAAVLLGGFFGSWIAAGEAWDLPLDSAQLRATGRSLGCGVIAMLDHDTCGAQVTADIAAFLGEQSARQCGPCVFGLRAIAAALRRIATGLPQPHDVARLRTWATEVRGRGACRHPDGAAGFVLSALDVFEPEFAHHSQGLACASSAPGAHPWTW